MQDLLHSKKFIAALVATVAAAALAAWRPDLSVQQILGLMSPLLAYIPAQGLADFGKARAQVEVERKASGGQS